MTQEEAGPQEERTFFGMPMNWELNPYKMARNWWNPEDERIFPPRVFGIGWDVNGHALLRRIGLLSGEPREEE